MVIGQCELPAGSSAFLCGKGKWELAANLSPCSWETTVHLLSQYFSSVMALALRLVKERPAPTTQAALDTAAGICAYDSKEVLMSLYAQFLSGTTSTTHGEGFGGLGGSVDHCSLWPRVSRQDNSALDLRKGWLHGVNKVVTYPCPSSFTCTFWSIMHIAFWLLFPCERQSQ